MADDAGALLVRSGLVSSSALADARARVANSGGTIGEHLVVAHAVADETLTDFYRSRLLVPQVNPNTLARLSTRVIATIPSDMAIELRVIPVALDRENNLTVAMSDPSNRRAVDEIAFFTGVYVVRAVATQMQIAWCLAHHYGHVTELGHRLLQPSAHPRAPTPVPPEVAPKPHPRTRGNTAKVDAARHRAVAPVTGPIEIPRPRSGALDQTRPAELPSAPRSDSSGIPEPTRGRSVSGEIAVAGRQRAPSIKPPIEAHDADDSGPNITVEVSAIAAGPSMRRHVVSDPPELAARAGEVEIATGPVRRVELDEPRIIVNDEPPTGADISGELRVITHRDLDVAAAATVEVADDEPGDHADGLRAHARPESEPVLLERRRPSQAPARAPSEDDIVMLAARKPRPERNTQVGIGALPALTRANPDGTAPKPAVATEPGSPDRDDLMDTGVMNVVDVEAAIAEREDDEWGPPGTTIPPPLLGAIPGSDDDDDEIPPLAIPNAVGSDLVRALEQATARSIELIRALELAQSRDEVVGLLAAHLGESHRRSGLFSIKGNELGVFSMLPQPGALPTATLRLDRASTLQDVVDTRLPYRGPMHDDASRSFLVAVLGTCPPEILLVPVAVRERVVGVLFGESRVRDTFDDQLAVAARAAGIALERILKAKRA